MRKSTKTEKNCSAKASKSMSAKNKAIQSSSAKACGGKCRNSRKTSSIKNSK